MLMIFAYIVQDRYTIGNENFGWLSFANEEYMHANFSIQLSKFYELIFWLDMYHHKLLEFYTIVIVKKFIIYHKEISSNPTSHTPTFSYIYIPKYVEISSPFFKIVCNMISWRNEIFYSINQCIYEF